ncbi:MAG: NapC/NirT family cytochrome c [Bacteroidales bacterium]|nr:NapC/NirT family cytochrome c [Bacteroidales bacterium]MCF8387291.1 NapC/NirT family cytochrome c [Bacteroidales bacterium]MCF8398725.1 NapC/NirT family cytochrome c [Bacteroidales bacterium]
MKIKPQFIFILTLFVILVSSFSLVKEIDKRFGSLKYKDFESPEYCGASCHVQFYRQWEQAMMSQAYTHHWDEIEYFELAVPHSENDPDFEGVHDGCNGCHTPMAYLAGDVPPPRPEEGSRANESVSCDVCHTITGFEGDVPFNFNYIIEPGQTKYSSRKGEKDSPNHEIKVSELHAKSEFCGICHNEKSPFDTWVKSTHLEWKEGPYAKEGVQCQDCHMPKARFRTAAMGTTYDDTRMHLFHGAHSPTKIKGVVELRMNPDIRQAVPGEPVVFTLSLFNQKTGHKFPTGSVEDRILWVHVEAEDAEGNVYHLPVDKKDFEGEEYTIASDVLAYQDMAVPLEKPDFKGVRREDVPLGDRIFRMPFFDPQGRMTIMQWNTDSLGVDYRIGPRETIVETYTFNLPYETAPGMMKVRAIMNYRLLVKPVAELLGVPEEEYAIREINRTETEIEVLP